MMLYFYIILLFFVHYAISNEEQYFLHEENYDFPKHIPVYEIRRDIYTKTPVQRGRLDLLGGLNRNNVINEKVTFAEFKKTLQCSPHEPELRGRRGSLSFLKLIDITKTTIERICAFLQVECDRWKGCAEKIDNLRSEPFSKTRYIGSPFQARLVRIIDNELFYDWPWGWGEYQNGGGPNEGMIEIIFSVISRISDIGNSVFLFGEEIGFLPWYIPMPAFSCAPKLSSSEMPWPWYEAFVLEKNLIANPNLNVSYYKKNSWANRIPKAVFYGTLRSDRQIFFDIAATRSDLIEGHWNSGGEGLGPWNPSSDEVRLKNEDPRFRNESFREGPSMIGTLNNLLKSKIQEGINYTPANYKFTVVLTGDGGESTSGRLSYLLSYSGSVVLIQDHDMAYTFSSYLKPWVHYVPLSFTGSDIIEKIEYLLQHDHIAERIATNAKNFGQSHLRYEDYLCYVATALKAVSNITSVSDANEPFNATKLIVPNDVYY